VVLPWSTCAIIAIFLIFCVMLYEKAANAAASEVPLYHVSLKKPIVAHNPIVCFYLPTLLYCPLYTQIKEINLLNFEIIFEKKR